MGICLTLALFRAAWRAGVLAAALAATAVAPVWAVPNAPVSALSLKDASEQKGYAGTIGIVNLFSQQSGAPRLGQEDYTEVIRAMEAFPDVVVFPIQVAGPAVAVRGSLANKVAGVGSIAVIYPEMAEPYRSVFAQIIDGIEAKAKGHVASYAMKPDVNVGELKDSLHRQDAKVVIALGRQGMKVASSLDRDMGVVVGGVLSAPENGVRELQVNSLSPDPALLFSRLKSMMPGAKKVFAVYDPRQNAWMMRLAKEAARAQGLELVAYEAQDLRSAMRAYQGIFAAADSDHDTLWLPQDSTTVEDSAVLPLVLRESWGHNLAVFSSTFSHVRRGALFSLYPNNVELGRYLAGSALDMLASGENGGGGMIPLREVLMAINLRTAKHLEIDASRQQKFDMAFPEP